MLSVSDVVSRFISFEDSLSMRDELASVGGCDGAKVELIASTCGIRTGAGNWMVRPERSIRVFSSSDDIWSRHSPPIWCKVCGV